MKIPLTLLLVVALALTAAPLPAAMAQGPQTQTIMIYIVGSDLEGDHGLATKDILEMLNAGIDQSRLNVLVMTGGTETWGNSLIPHDKLGIYKVEGRSPTLLHQEATRSMGEADTLSYFLQFGVEQYPAESYGLILWDHGGGPMVGFGVDDLHMGDGLTLIELRKAMENSPFAKDARLEWLAFDACLMASVEVASMMAPHARYLIASEETLPGQGFDYGFLGTMGAGGLTGDAVAREIIRHTAVYYETAMAINPRFKPMVTLSLLDLDLIDPVEQAVDRLFSDLLHGMEVDVYSDIARSRDASKVYGETATTSHFDLIDLNDLAGQMARKYPQEAMAVQQAIQDAVLFNYTNVPRSAGLALYFPLNSKTNYQRAWRHIYKEFEIMPEYQAFMDRFGDILMADSLSLWQGNDAPPVVYDQQTGAYHIQLTPEQVANYARAEYYILARLQGEEYRLVFVSSDVALDENGRLTANFDGNVLYVSDDQTAPLPVPFLRETENLDGIAHYQIPAVLQRRLEDGGLDSLNGSLLAQLDKASATAQLTGAIRDEAPDIQVGKQDLDLDEWQHVLLPYLSFYLTRGETGDPLVLGDWAAGDKLFVTSFSTADNLRISYMPLDRASYDYFVMMSVVDTQDYAYPSELMPLPAPEIAQADDGPPIRPQVREVAFDMEAPAPVLLTQEHDLRISLMGVDFSAVDQADGRQAPDTLHLELLIENNAEGAIDLTADWLSVNGIMMPVDFAHSIPARRGTTQRLSIPIAPAGDGNSLVERGIAQVEDIRFGFSLRPEGSGLMDNDLQSEELRLKTLIPVGAGYEMPQALPFDPVLLSDTEGLLIEQTGPISIHDGQLLVPLKVTNNSENFDLVRVTDSSVNGIMAPLTLSQEDVLPGSVLYTTASIPLLSMEIPPELEEFRYLLDTPSLDKLGIQEVKEISLRLEMTAKSRLTSVGRLNIARETAYFTIPVPGMEEYQQPFDTAGTVLVDEAGIEVVRLDSDPEGKRLYLHNANDKTIRLISFGKVWVDDQPYGGNMPIFQVLSPGASAYHSLFEFLPGIEPQGDELSFLLSILDDDQNSMLQRTDRITLTLK